MNKKSRYITFALIAFCISIPRILLAAETVNYTDEDLEEEQRVIDSYVRDAESDLKYAQANFGRDMINSAWWYVTESGIKIDQARVLMKNHPQRIERCNIAWYESATTERQKLRDGHARLKNKIDKANGLLKAVEKDVGTRLGLDIGAFRDTLAILKLLCEKNLGAQYCDYFNRLKGLIEAGKAAEASAFASQIASEIAQACQDNPSVVVDLPSGWTPPSSQDFEQKPGSGTSAPANTGSATQTGGAAVTTSTQGAVAATGAATSNLSDEEKNKLFSEAQQVQQELEEVYKQTNDPKVLELAEQLKKAIAEKDVDKIRQIMEEIRNYKGELVITDTGEIIFVHPKDKTVAPAYIAGEYGGQLRVEKIYKLVESEETPGEYKAKLLQTIDWQFAIDPQLVSDQGSGATYSISLKDLNGNTNFKIDSWHVYNPDGSVNTTGDGNPLQVVLSGSGDYRIIVEGTTEHDKKGSPFKIETIIRL